MENIQGTVFLSGHPKQAELLDDQRLGVIAIRAGVYRYQNRSD